MLRLKIWLGRRRRNGNNRCTTLINYCLITFSHVLLALVSRVCPPNTITTVVDNTDVSGAVSGCVSVSQPVSVSPVSQVGFSATWPTGSQGVFTSDISSPFSQSGQLSHSTNSSYNGPTRSKPLLVDTVLSFIVAYCLKGDSDCR